VRYEPRTVEAEALPGGGYQVTLPSGQTRMVPAAIFEALYRPVAPAPELPSAEETS
jgi:hypothetical protein